MAIFTTLRPTVVLSTILPNTTDPCFAARNARLLVNSYPFPGHVYPPASSRAGATIWGAFRRFSGSLGRIVPPFLRCALDGSLLCCVSSSVPPPELLLRLCPLSSQRNAKLHFLSNPIGLTSTAERLLNPKTSSS